MGGGSSTVAPQEDTNNQNEANGVGSSTKSNRICNCFPPKQPSKQYSFDETEDSELKEEAKEWATNFDKLLNHPVGLKIFQEFLQSQFSDENLRFWMEVEKYRNLNIEDRKIRAKSLYDEFVSSFSPCEVSLDARHRTQIEQNMAEAHKDLFKQAQDYIFSLMYRDCLPRFLKSKSYKKLVR